MPRASLIQFRRGTAAAIRAAAANIGVPGEPLYATDSGELFMADGSNPPSAVSRSFNGVGNPPSNALVMPWNMTGMAATAMANNVLQLLPYDIWPAPLTIKAFAYSVSTAIAGQSGTAYCRAVLYSDNGTGAGPSFTAGSLLANVDILAALATTGLKTPAVALTLRPGRYWGGVLWAQGSAAATTPAQLLACVGSTAIWSTTAAFASNRLLQRSGVSTVPTDSVLATPGVSSSGIVLGLQAA